LFGTGKVAVKDKTNVYTLGARMDVLANMDASVILPHVAEEQQLKFAFESIFRSITRTLMDNASSEYCFDCEFFFAPRGKKTNENNAASVANEIFNDTFGKTLRMILVRSVNGWLLMLGYRQELCRE
jgi:hypothetical protein